ncbi:hypothetical protein Agabi119p4_3530 [Agaricus bisporus var. burnettii]|uniref:PEBP-like protein n=1 Tax=Agaricus bisporus var. burnettii TaxID=192524 RepID=A0A8H7KI40_AGABI|nr:hypothetical protein Agabi119p4_3530 [Agaricus bisporus var. burnettii]
MHSYLAIVSTFLALAAAQQNSDTNMGLAAIEAHFNQSHIVPDLLSAFQPQAVLGVNFGAGDIQPGQKFTIEEAGSAPTLTVNSSSPLNGSYVLAMIDADVPNSQLQKHNRHWLVGNVTVGQDSVVSNATATSYSRYFGPFPPSGSGPHRYVIMLYAQPSDFNPPAEFATTDLPVEPMDWQAYVNDSHLGGLVAANYIQVEQGTASASIFSTAPVVSSTLVAASTTAGSATTSSTQTGSSNESNGAKVLDFHVPAVMCLATLATLLLA